MMRFLSLLVLILLPVISAIIIAGPWFPNHEVKIRRTAKTFSSIIFIYSLLFLVFFNTDIAGYQFKQAVTMNTNPWIDNLGVSLSFGIDGISLALIILTTFLFLLANVASKNTITTKTKLYYPLLFLVETAVLGVFCAKDLLIFFLFWELELIPMYLLISIWGSGKKSYSAMKFLLYTFFGSIFMLGSFLALAYYYYINLGVLTFDLEAMTAIKSYSYPVISEILIFLGLFIGFAVKLPIVPFHTWLPDAHTDAPTPISMILAGILLKMGGYGLLRMNFQIMPDTFTALAWVIGFLGVINIIYGAILAFAQTDGKRLVAYSSISHMGIFLLGIAALTTTGMTGAVLQLLAHGVISAGLFMILGIIYFRFKTRNLDELGGVGTVMPRLMYFSLIIILASIGLPLLIGFVAELLVFAGAFLSDVVDWLKPLTIIGISGMILSAGYLLWACSRIFFGNLNPKFNKIHDITPHELFVLVAITSVIVFFGVYPSGLINLFESTVYNLLKII